MSNILGKGALNTTTLKRKEVYIPEWGGNVLVRELTIAEKAELADIDRSTPGAAMRSALTIIKLGWINEDGSHVLTNDDDVRALGEQPETVVTVLMSAIADLSNVDAERAKKNSTMNRSGASVSS